jgi:predicted RNA binding protein YcfA (HicA-like mRNA interferase family)
MSKIARFRKITPEYLINDIIIYIFVVSKQGNMKRYKVKEVIKLLENDGWYLAYQEGSHRQFRHPTKTGKVTVNAKPNDTLSQDILNSIWKQAGWK